METGTTVLDIQKKYGSRSLVLSIGAGLLFLAAGQKEICRGLVLGGVFSAVNFVLMGQLLRYRLIDNRKAAIRRSFVSLLFLPTTLYSSMEYFCSDVTSFFM